jgi:uncharacterized protein YndB with AHSA1/START domain
MELDLETTLENAWRALTDARELTRWFPLTARVEGRPGGDMVWDWGERFHWASRIDVWEPPRRLRLVQDVERPRDIEGNPLADGAIAPSFMAMEFTLETVQGKTRLRLVHSGFGEGAAWDDELDGVRNGWAFELRGLAHYLAHHRGHDRHIGWGTVSTETSHSAVWQRLLGPDGYQLEGRTLGAGERFSVRTPGGDRFSGIVLVHNPEREFAGAVQELDDGVFRLGTWSGGGAVGINVWIATWSPAQAERVTRLGSDAQDFLDRTFGTMSTAGERSPR